MSLPTQLNIYQGVGTNLDRITSTKTSRKIVDLLARYHLRELSAKPIVHPLFIYHQWHNSISPDQYFSILPALALASHYLTLPRTTNYIYAMLRCPTKIRLDSRNRSYEEFTWLCTDPNQPLKAVAQQTYDGWLMALVPHLRLFPDNSLPDSTCAMCWPDEELELSSGNNEPILASILPAHQPGWSSTMRINHRTILEMDPRRASRDRLLLSWKDLANTLIHELIHAITYAHRGQYWFQGEWKAKEKWFAEDNYVESGFSWERHVMGGILNKKGNQLRSCEIDRRHCVKCYGDMRTSFPVDCTCVGQTGSLVCVIEAKDVMAELQNVLERQ